MNTCIKILSLFIILGFVFSGCSEEADPEVFYSVSGVVNYPDGTADGAIVYLAAGNTPTTNYTDVTVADELGNYAFDRLPAGDYFLFADYNTMNTNSLGRYGGSNFSSDDSNLITISTADVNHTITLVNEEPAGVTVDNTEGGDWSLDGSHSEVVFEFPFDDGNATFSGRFDDYDFEFNFDDSDLANSTIYAWVDLTTVVTGQPGRDGGHNCISRTFGVEWTDFDQDGEFGEDPEDTVVGTSGESFFESTSIELYGDGYKAKGDFTFHGVTSEIEVYFNFIDGFVGTNRQGIDTKFSSFEAMFEFDAIDVFGIENSHIMDDIKVFASVQINRPL